MKIGRLFGIVWNIPLPPLFTGLFINLSTAKICNQTLISALCITWLRIVYDQSIKLRTSAQTPLSSDYTSDDIFSWFLFFISLGVWSVWWTQGSNWPPAWSATWTTRPYDSTSHRSLSDIQQSDAAHSLISLSPRSLTQLCPRFLLHLMWTMCAFCK